MMLVAGAVLGLVLVAVNLFQTPKGSDPGLSKDMAVSVNGTGILATDFKSTLDRYALSRGGSLDAADSTRILEAMIDEELLVQRARELGIDRNDRLVRDLMAKTVVEVVAMAAESTEPTPEEIEAFFVANQTLFASPLRVRVREIRVEVNQFRTAVKAGEIARTAADRLKRGDEFSQVNRQTGDRPAEPLPDRLLSESELRRYLGSAAAARALELKPGQVSEPVRSGSSFHVLVMVEGEAPVVPPLTEVEARVKSEMLRRAHLGAIEEYIAELRAAADIQLMQP